MKNAENMVKENEQVQANTEMAAESVEMNEGMGKREKWILFIAGVILFLLLIVWMIFCVNGFMRSGIEARGENGSAAASTGITASDDQNSSADSTTPSDSVTTVPPTNGGDGTKFPAVTPDGNSGNQKPTGNNGGGSTRPTPGQNSTDSGNNGEKNDNDNTGSSDENSKPTEPSGGTDNNGTDSKPGDGNDKEDTAPSYTGEVQVRISDVTVDTGIITVTVDGEKITVPVQTTVFNGRVTKSGVAQGKLFGYNCGATIMLFYPETDGFTAYQVNGYMSRTKDGLTVLVDINGSGSKLLIKINGMMALA